MSGFGGRAVYSVQHLDYICTLNCGALHQHCICIAAGCSRRCLHALCFALQGTRAWSSSPSNTAADGSGHIFFVWVGAAAPATRGPSGTGESRRSVLCRLRSRQEAWQYHMVYCGLAVPVCTLIGTTLPMRDRIWVVCSRFHF